MGNYLYRRYASLLQVVYLLCSPCWHECFGMVDYEFTRSFLIKLCHVCYLFRSGINVCNCHLSHLSFVTLALGIRILSFYPKCWIKLFFGVPPGASLAAAPHPQSFCVPFCVKEFFCWNRCMENLAVVMHFPEIAALRIKGGWPWGRPKVVNAVNVSLLEQRSLSFLIP